MGYRKKSCTESTPVTIGITKILIKLIKNTKIQDLQEKYQAFQQQGRTYGFMTCSLITQHSHMNRLLRPSGAFQNQAARCTPL